MFCRWCGRPRAVCDEACSPTLEPIRFCPDCGRKLDVQVTPKGYRASCRKHGETGRV